MIINAATLDAMFKGFKTLYTTAALDAPSQASEVAMTVTSAARDETYNWLGQFPQMREWVGDERVIRQLEAHGFTITNRKFESTISIGRDDIADDRLGVFSPVIQSMGYEAAIHPDHVVFGLLAAGFATECYDGQSFFDTEHPVVDEDGPVTDADGRQMAYASRAPLNKANHEAARTAMQRQVFDKGRPLGIKPTVLVVPPELEGAAMRLLNTEHVDGGNSNEWKGTAKPIVTPFLNAA
ncbi:Mu-like prophage major head subunit gpT family protein [Roseibaca sp. V10]|uniref:Mu-like prophage major head subunit gpT family protein n=1 Tax=Roseinatronobacter domitianus TaxID=2940293 RepID=A0ABT0LZS7_9RHOB|nr:Mu-like prophage major head subunit gpT family protein [Roseibaca domitiana]MCL1628124.1 Mu-like prophage major head subunit gpT family protein [Roseibaca domitiana]